MGGSRDLVIAYSWACSPTSGLLSCHKSTLSVVTMCREPGSYHAEALHKTTATIHALISFPQEDISGGFQESGALVLGVSTIRITGVYSGAPSLWLPSSSLTNP